jgi:hypothetical protein
LDADSAAEAEFPACPLQILAVHQHKRKSAQQANKRLRRQTEVGFTCTVLIVSATKILA